MGLDKGGMVTALALSQATRLAAVMSAAPLQSRGKASADAYAFSALSTSSFNFSSRQDKMPLEATMIVLDNSEYMRNGDYQPTRFGALADAVTTLFQTKIDSNPENTVGVMTMANKGCAPPKQLSRKTPKKTSLLTFPSKKKKKI